MFCTKNRFFQGPVDLKWAWYILRIFCPTSFSQINSLCLDYFLCYSKIIYVRTAWNFFSGLKLTDLGEFFVRFLLFTLFFAILFSRSKYLFLWQEQLRLLLEGRPYEELHEFCDFRCVKPAVQTSVCSILRILGSWHLSVYQIENFFGMNPDPPPNSIT